MARDFHLPLVLAHAAGQRFDCHGCTNCCRDMVVRLLPSDRERLDARSWDRVLGLRAYVKLRGEWVLNMHADGRCVFLEDDGKCRIHREHGPAEKPLACRLFPFRIVPGKERWRIAWRFDCPTIARSEGRPVFRHEADVAGLAAHFSTPDLSTMERGGDEFEESAASTIVLVCEAWLRRAELPATRRISIVASLAAVLADPAFSPLAGEDFVQLIRSVGKALGDAGPTTPAPPTDRQRAMLRLAAFVHCEHVSLAVARSAWRRVGLRFNQLRRAGRFRRGRGIVPPIMNAGREVSFAEVEAIAPATEEAETVGELILRYLRVMLDSRAFYGPAYYGWSVREGFAALMLRVPIIGWLARVHAASRNRAALVFEDVAAAVGRVDQSAGRLKSLGSTAERLRLKYLLREQGLLRIMKFFSPTPGTTPVTADGDPPVPPQ